MDATQRNFWDQFFEVLSEELIKTFLMEIYEGVKENVAEETSNLLSHIN